MTAAVRRLLPVLLAAALPLARAGGEPADSDITTLDPVFVEASTGTPWRYLSVPGFEVLSHCSDSFNAAYVKALRQATAARLALLPAAYWGDIPTPMKLILYNREPAMTEGYRSRRPIDLAWSGGSADAVMLTHPLVVGDGDTFISCGNYWDIQGGIKDLCVDPDSDVRLSQRAPRLPAWFVAGVEGPRGVYGEHRIFGSPHGERLVLRAAEWTTAAETLVIRAEADPPDHRAPRPGAHLLLPMEELFAGRVRPGQENLWNAEAALFVRWGLFAAPDRAAFLALVDDATREPVTEAMLERDLGLTYEQARQRLAAYLGPATVHPIELPLPPIPEEAAPARDATSAEVARVVGDWGRLEGRALGLEDVDFQNECLGQADKLFHATASRRTRDPLFLASYGLYALQRGDKAGAGEALERATAAGVARPRAYVELARLRLDAALPHGEGRLSDDELVEVLGLLGTARQQMPSLQATYLVLARALAHAPAVPTRAQLQPLGDAVQLYPADVPFAHQVAALYAGYGFREEAAAIVGRSLKFAGSEAERSFLTSVVGK